MQLLGKVFPEKPVLFPQHLQTFWQLQAAAAVFWYSLYAQYIALQIAIRKANRSAMDE